MSWYPSGTGLLAVAMLFPFAVRITTTHGVARDATIPETVATAAAPAPKKAVRLVVADSGNEARYRVREQLARIDFPTDAIGTTRAVTGAITIADDGSIVKDASKFTVDLTTLKSDSDRRDGFIQRRTLQTADFPTAEFVPTAVAGLPSPLPATGSLQFKVAGDLTVHGVTRPITWTVTGNATDHGYTGSAATAFTFADFGMDVPRVPVLLSVKDTIRLEYDFLLVPAR